jgi:spore maturation protein CgeB
MKIVIYGLAITSSWGNGHATTYRSLCKALAQRGHAIHFVEKDAEWYRNNRDLPQPAFCTVHHYDHWSQSAHALLHLSHDADAIVVGSFFPDAIAATRALLERGYGPVLFYDIDTPITLSGLRTQGRTDYLEASDIPAYAAYLSFTGGPALLELERRFGSPCAVPLYCSVDAAAYKLVPPRNEFACDLSYLGTYASDRQPKLMRLLNETAARLPESSFIVAGAQYPKGVPWGSNVKRMIHLSPREHPSFYSSSRFTLNLTRDEMVDAGYSPSVRLFEASACGTPILSDSWPGLDQFLTPGQEILIPRDSYEVVQILIAMPEGERVRIGRMACERILARHRSEHRAAEFEAIVERCHHRRSPPQEAVAEAM